MGYERMDFMYEELVGEIEDREFKDELDIYLRESVVNSRIMVGVEYDVLFWWKFNVVKFSVFVEIVKDVFVM